MSHFSINLMLVQQQALSIDYAIEKIEDVNLIWR